MSTYNFPELKKRQFNRHCRIISTGAYFPPNVITNNDIIQKYRHSVTDVAVHKTIGTKERRIAEPGTADSDLLVKAAQQCLKRAQINTDRLSKILVTKFVGDRTLPMTASMVQKKLNCSQAIQSFDIDGGTNSFLQALDIASNAINNGDTYILVVSGGICNAIVNKYDPRLAFLFGDGAAAILLGPSDRKHIVSSYFYTNYTYINLSTGFPHRKKFGLHNTETDKNSFYDLYETGDWNVAKNFILEGNKVTLEKLLTDSSLNIQDIDLFIVSENNYRQWKAIIESLHIDPSRVISVLRQFGNTMSAMIPVLINKAFEEERVCDGKRIAILSTGEGISGGGIIYNV